MSPTECVAVVEFLAARCPAMRMHEQTPDAWYVDLVAHTRDDAMEAVRRCSRRASFVSLAELLTEVVTVERERVGRQRTAEREQQIAAENGGNDLTTARPLRALLAGTPLKPAPRDARWPERQVPVASKPPFTAAELAAAKAELDRAVEAGNGNRCNVPSDLRSPSEVL